MELKCYKNKWKCALALALALSINVGLQIAKHILLLPSFHLPADSNLPPLFSLAASSAWLLIFFFSLFKNWLANVCVGKNNLTWVNIPRTHSNASLSKESRKAFYWFVFFFSFLSLYKHELFDSWWREHRSPMHIKATKNWIRKKSAEGEKRLKTPFY